MTVVGATRNLCVGPEAGRYPQEEVACLILPTQLNHLTSAKNGKSLAKAPAKAHK